MASPQLEDGYFKIANDIYDALCRTRIPGEARQVFDFIIRKTYGFRKKTDMISLSQFANGTGLKKPNILRAINKLRAINIVIIQKDNANANIFSINKDFDSWKPLSKKITLSKKIISVIQKDNGVIQKDKNRYPKRYPQNTVLKDNITKDNTTKNKELLKKAHEILDLLNETFKKSFKHTDGNLCNIKARLREGYAIEDFRTVFQKKKRDPVFIKKPLFYRPQTLCSTKFDSYLNESVSKSQMTDVGTRSYIAGREFIEKQREIDAKQ